MFGFKDLRERISNYMRVLAVARKPGKEEFLSSSKICGLGMIIIGVVGLVVFLVFHLV